MRRRLVLVLVLGAACRAPALPEAQCFPAGTDFTARVLAVPGTTLRYLDAGRGTPVVFIHGVGASIYAWRKNLAPVRDAGFRVIAFDTPGFGFSEPLGGGGGYTNAAYVDVVTAVLDSLHLPDAVLVGQSMGGAIAAEVALVRPSRVRGLVLIGSAGLGAREPLLFRVARWPVVGPLMLAFRGRGLTERLLKSTYSDPRKVTAADVDQYYAPVARPGYARALRAVLRQFRFDALRGRLDAVRAPTLVLWGEEDRWVPLALGRALAAQLPHSALVTVVHAGHSVQEEAPDQVNRLLIKFLTEGPARVPENLALAAF